MVIPKGQTRDHNKIGAQYIRKRARDAIQQQIANY